MVEVSHLNAFDASLFKSRKQMEPQKWAEKKLLMIASQL
jgi:hypothetical protein